MNLEPCARPDHSISEAREGAVHVMNPNTGQVAREYGPQKAGGAYR
jgi:hypothetical protein